MFINSSSFYLFTIYVAFTYKWPHNSTNNPFLSCPFHGYLSLKIEYLNGLKMV